MSRTLFAYIFKDLFRVFMMASGALAGIMSFGGLLRPLTREGLDAGQVGRMLMYFGPAMTTYSFPVAALFATAVVYGRLSADNELTACKAGGISLLSLTVSGPALVLGLLVAIVSLLFLCFIVPASTLRVEKVIYSNLAKLVQSRIERTHEIDLQQSTIFAQEARVLPTDPDFPSEQRVELIGPAVISTERDIHDKTLLLAKDFYTASRAIAYIDPAPNGEQVNVTVYLSGGFKFPSKYIGATLAGVETTEYGPMQIPSPIKEDVKFMNVFRLKELYADVSKSARLKSIIADFVKVAQRRSFTEDLTDTLNQSHEARFDFGDGGSYSLEFQGDGIAASIGDEVTVPYRMPGKAPVTVPSADISATHQSERVITYREDRVGHEPFVLHAAYAVIHATPITETGMMEINIELQDCVQMIKAADGVGEMAAGTKKYSPPRFQVAMKRWQRDMAGRSIAYYESDAGKFLGNQVVLTHEKMTLINSIIAESNGRASFAVSCLILVMLGSALGMMFRSGNFLTAFAVSFIPAMLSITLIIAGQRTAGNLPLKFDAANHPLKLGLTLIWSGNAVNLLLASGLLWKLGRR